MHFDRCSYTNSCLNAIEIRRKKAYNLWAWNEYSDSKNWIVKQEKQSISTHKYCSSLVLSLAYWCECVFLYRALIYGENDFGHCKIKCSCVFDTILAHSEIEDETICTNELRMKYKKATTTTEKCQPEKQTAKTRQKSTRPDQHKTKPLHSQVIYDIEIDDNFYYMHFRLNLRNKIVDYFFLSFLLLGSVLCRVLSMCRWAVSSHYVCSPEMRIHFIHVWLCLFSLISFCHCIRSDRQRRRRRNFSFALRSLWLNAYQSGKRQRRHRWERIEKKTVQLSFYSHWLGPPFCILSVSCSTRLLIFSFPFLVQAFNVHWVVCSLAQRKSYI